MLAVLKRSDGASHNTNSQGPSNSPRSGLTMVVQILAFFDKLNQNSPDDITVNLKIVGKVSMFLNVRFVKAWKKFRRSEAGDSL